MSNSQGMNKKEVQLILNQLNVIPNKKLGQNFIVDSLLTKKIISISELNDNDIILEIGPGLGALTERLVKIVKKVYAVEIDRKLISFLIDKFSSFDNIEVINGDILKIDIPKVNKVISNLPFTITGPIFEKVFFIDKPPHGILTIEKSIADRIFFRNEYKNFSRITVSTNSFMNPIRKYKISRNSFYPQPKIALSLIDIASKNDINDFLLNDKNREFYLRFIGGIMPYKNKDLVNALYLFLKNGFKLEIKKDDILSILRQNNIKNDKLNSFKINDFVIICKIIYKII
jgi:16S rRNA (adenine1518-N6/adenine1519-N6)-dimethyltransferase